MMNFNQFVVRNTLRNKHLYLAYFLSTLMSVMTFMSFTALAHHPQLAHGLDSRVALGMNVASVIIYLFSFLFVLYSMDIFIQSRKKEFGLLMIQGMSPKQLKKMVFIENLVIGFFATIAGCIVGLGFSQLIILFSKKAMNLNFGFYFPIKAAGITFVAFMILFFIISLFIQQRLPKMNVQELLKAGDLGKGIIKFSPIKGIVGIVLILVGYLLAIIARGAFVMFVMVPVIVLVIVGTSLFFNQASVMIIERLKKNPKRFWKKTNMVVFSDLSFRMKDNARAFILVAVISAVAFTSIGALFGVQQLIMSGVDTVSYEFQSSTDAKTLAPAAKQLETDLKKENIDAQKIETTSYQEQGNEYLTEASYNTLAKASKQDTVHLNGQAILLHRPANMAEESKSYAKSVTVNGKQLAVKEKLDSSVYQSVSNTYVVPDDTDFGTLQTGLLTVWIPHGATESQLVKIGTAISNSETPYITAKTAMVKMITDVYSPVLFVGVFIGIVFFISAGSFLYFRLYSDLDNDIEKFKMIYKVGLTKKELKKMVSQQVGILFFTPIIVSLLHGVVALTAMYNLFEMGLQSTALIVLGIFLVIQVVYYLFARTFYFRKIYSALRA
jgi:putative ABC transport system permease protein